MAGDAATNAAGRVRPSDEQLSEMDRPAEDNTWHETPNLSKDNIKQQAGRFYGGDAKKDAQDVANAGQEARAGNGSAINAVANVAQQKVNENVDDESKDKARQRKEELRQRTREYFGKKMPQERKDQTIWRLKVCDGYLTYTHLYSYLQNHRKWSSSASSIRITCALFKHCSASLSSIARMADR